ncbi:MAG: glutathione transferase GstA [Deltaproteobacteria bacterium]|jgi:glutathione S-transferase|nr:glutathione transferase GstA [Deltaproteobacteria bacterium]
MELYFSPLACSMGTRIAFYEAGIEARFIAVDTRAKRLADGSDFLAVNPMGQVPVLRMDNGELLTENPAVLQYVADARPQAGLAPRDGIARYRLQQWLNFISTELHKVVFVPLLDPTMPDAGKAYARQKAEPRLAYLNARLKGKEYLLDRFTVADAYLVTVLNWARFTAVDFAKWPAVKSYMDRMYQRPSVAKALVEETRAYQDQEARRAPR